MAGERDQASEAEEILLDEEAASLQPGSKPTRRATLVSVSLLAVAAVLALLAWSTEGPAKGPFTRVSSRPMLVELDEEPDLCGSLPSLQILKVKSSNLGGKGPDKTAEEGLIYTATPHNEGLGNLTDVELHFHVVSESAFLHSEDEGTEVSTNYNPAWPSQNGINGGFAVVNIQASSNVTLRVRAYNPATQEDILLPKAAVTFFDLDAGQDGNRSVEYVKVDHFAAYYLTNETEIKVSQGEGGTTFTASKEGSGDDNPKDPLQLTVLQKNRAVSVVFENEKSILVELGASAGKTNRVFSFVLLPALRCAKTVLDDGTIIDANSTDSPITVVRGAGEQARPLVLLVLGLALVGSPWR